MSEAKKDTTFHCERWPMCNCPDGAVKSDCPGLKRLKETSQED